MNIPRYWARATAERPDPTTRGVHFTTAFGHSNVSPADASRDGKARAERVLDWLCSDCETPDPERYPYGADRPLREQVVREIGSGDDRVAAFTRNAQGVLVLNTAHVMFIDVDEQRPSLSARIVGRLFRRTPADPLATLRQAIVDTPSLGARIYRTAAGWRGLVTSQLVDPIDPAVDDIMARSGADLRYRALCRVQQSFRARLTPKPWRCKVSKPPSSFPFADLEAEKRFATWLRNYEQVAANFAVCELIESVGVPTTDPTAAMIVREHDALTLRPNKPLA